MVLGRGQASLNSYDEYIDSCRKTESVWFVSFVARLIVARSMAQAQGPMIVAGFGMYI